MFYSKAHFQITKFWLVLSAVIVMVMFLSMMAFAQLPSTVHETSIAITFNEIAGSRGWGALGAVPFKTGAIAGNASAIAQGGDNIVRGKYHAEIGTTVKGFDFNLYTDGVFKGYTVRDIGRQSDVGLAIEIPDFDVGNFFHATGGAGIFGRNAGHFGPPNARGTLEAAGYDPNTLDRYPELPTIRPPPSGLSIKAGNSLNALLYVELVHPSGLNIVVKGMPELVGQGDNAVHQLIVTPSASFELRDNINLEVGADVGFQTFAGAIESELATLIAIKLSF